MFRRLTIPMLMGQALALAMLLVWVIATSSVWGSVGASDSLTARYAFLVFWLSYPLLLMISWAGLRKEIKPPAPSRLRLAIYNALPLIWIVIGACLLMYVAAVTEHYE